MAAEVAIKNSTKFLICRNSSLHPSFIVWRRPFILFSVHEDQGRARTGLEAEESQPAIYPQARADKEPPWCQDRVKDRAVLLVHPVPPDRRAGAGDRDDGAGGGALRRGAQTGVGHQGLLKQGSGGLPERVQEEMIIGWIDVWNIFQISSSSLLLIQCFAQSWRTVRTTGCT